MIEESFSSAIFDREKGIIDRLPKMRSVGRTETSGVFSSSHLPSILEIFGNHLVNKNDEIVWIGAKENVLITLNCSGQVVFYNLLVKEIRITLNTCQESALKAFFALDYLILSVKPKDSENIHFYLIPFKSLQNNNPVRTQALPGLILKYAELIEIHTNSFKIVIKGQENIQIWNLLTEQCEFSFPVSPQISYKYSGNHFIFWVKQKNETRVGVFNTKSSKTVNFTLKTQENIYFSHVFKEFLILGIMKCNFQQICLKTLKCKVIFDKIPRFLTELEVSDRIFTVFQDGSCMVNFNSNKIVDAGIFSDVWVCESQGQVVFCDFLGKIGKIVEGKLQIFETRLVEIETIGSNADTGEIYVVSQGKIFIYE
jgi:hypothetical protein